MIVRHIIVGRSILSKEIGTVETSTHFFIIYNFVQWLNNVVLVIFSVNFFIVKNANTIYAMNVLNRNDQIFSKRKLLP